MPKRDSCDVLSKKIRDWKDVNFYPFFDPPEGQACRAVNIARSLSGLCPVDFVRQRLINCSSEEDLSLEDVEHIEEWVNPETGEFRFCRREIEEFAKRECLEGTFEHLKRIGYDLNNTFPDGEAVFFYTQPTARYRFFWVAKAFGLVFCIVVLVVFGILDAHGGSFRGFLTSCASFLKVIGLWLIEVAAPLVFLGTTALSSFRWIRRRLKGDESNRLEGA